MTLRHVLVEQKYLNLFDFGQPSVIGDKERGPGFHSGGNLEGVV